MPKRTNTTKQWITFGLSCVVLVIVAVYRFSTAGPESAAAVVTTVGESSAGSALSELNAPSGVLAWNLPKTEDLDAFFAINWKSPAFDPFVLSTTLRQGIETPEPPDTPIPHNMPIGDDDEPDDVPHAPPPPTVHIRSTYRVAGQWYAEIDGLSYRVGDMIDDYRITRIAPDAVWLAFLGWNPTDCQLRTSCSLRIGSNQMGMVNGQWVHPGQSIDSGVVLAIENDRVIVKTQKTVSNNPKNTSQTFEVKVTHAP